MRIRDVFGAFGCVVRKARASHLQRPHLAGAHRRRVGGGFEIESELRIWWGRGGGRVFSNIG